MALLQILSTRTTIAPQSSLDGVKSVTFDATTSREAELSVTVTDHPVEDGFSVSDHIRDDPDQILITAIVSKTPVELMPLLLAERGNDRHAVAWMDLSGWLKQHILVKVVTPSKTWDNMVIQKLSRTQSADAGESPPFTIRLKEIRKVVLAEAVAVARPEGVQKSHVDVGTATAAPVSDQAIGSFLFHGPL